MGRNDIQPAQLILCGIVLLCGYFIFLGKLLSRCDDRRTAPAIALTLLAVFGGVSAAVLYLSALLGGHEASSDGTSCCRLGVFLLPVASGAA